MKIKLDTESKFNFKITIDRLSCSIANSLRRIMISEVPTISIDLVSVEINTSLINDEFLSHRLGLIPLKSGFAKKMKYTRECECDNYCSKCSYIFILDLKSKEPETMIYSTHLLNSNQENDFLGNSISPVHDSGSNTKFSSKAILIGKLKIGQQLKVFCIAKKGIGLEHSKWSPVSVIKLKVDPIFYLDLENLNKSLSYLQKKKLHLLAKEILDFDEKKSSLLLQKNNSQHLNFFSQKDIKFLFDYLFEQELLSENILKLDINDSKITFNIETTGVLDINDLFVESISILKRKLNILGIHLERLS